MRIFRLPRIYAAACAGLLAISLLGGAALAQERDGDGPPAERAGHHHHLPYLGLRAIVHASGLDFEVFRAGFAEDKSINAILEENGIDPATVKRSVLEKLQAKLDEAVANGRITEEKADGLYERASAKLDTLMSSAPDDLPRPGRPFRAALRHAVTTAAELIGIEPLDLRQALMDGSTVGGVANEHGVDPQTIVDTLVADAHARIDEKAAADGWDDEKVAELKARAAERIATWVNEGGPHKRMGAD